MRCRFLLTLVLLPSLATSSPAGIIFGGKKTAKPPAERVPELITLALTSGDENKRSEAVEELRQYDPGQFPQIVPALIEVLTNDKKPAVRAEAAQSLGKLRPISQQAGQALEQALSKDPSVRVRLQARSSLLQYHWAGYRNDGKPANVALPQTKEPPLAVPSTKEPPLLSPIPQAMTKPAAIPAAPPAPLPPIVNTTSNPQPLPKGPQQSPPHEEKGPDLIPPE
ncbi:MAG TPA: HEAT repeat domain-containing protein [Gemmataceae bacterium]|nr:HEAT repeat domain-containing protein [Gemmataceae bacterium]